MKIQKLEKLKYSKNLLTVSIEELQQQYEEETERSTEIDDLETYMKSSQYIEDVAKSKLGLTYKNEIIFKEKK